jgi:hypothetical protein
MPQQTFPGGGLLDRGCAASLTAKLRAHASSMNHLSCATSKYISLFGSVS